jgi:type IV pilus assembly protein PilA
MRKERNKKGFTLLEILLVIAIIAILASIIIVALNPSKQLADSRNAERRADVNTIINAIYQYAIDNDGDFPDDIPVTSTCSAVTEEICIATLCTSFTDLNDLIPDYIVDIPEDPLNESVTGSGYAAVQHTTSDRIIVCAPDAERSVTIEVER